MNTAKQTMRDEAKVIPINGAETKKLIHAAWIAAKSAFWSNETFTKRESEAIERLVAAHFADSPNLRTRFSEIIQRICLVKRYLSRQQGRYIAKPIDWLNIHFQYGFVATESWLEQIKEQRKLVPHYNKGIAVLANQAMEKVALQILRKKKVEVTLKQIKFSYNDSDNLTHGVSYFKAKLVGKEKELKKIAGEDKPFIYEWQRK
ncbi:MAG: hypothetical protein AB1540_17545 [Bdellovibrionota bacterium]